MRNLRSQLLLRITRFLDGHLNIVQLVAWAKDQIDALRTPQRSQPLAVPVDPVAEQVLYQLAALTHHSAVLESEISNRNALLRTSLRYYKAYLEGQAPSPVGTPPRPGVELPN